MDSLTTTIGTIKDAIYPAINQYGTFKIKNTMSKKTKILRAVYKEKLKSKFTERMKNTIEAKHNE